MNKGLFTHWKSDLPASLVVFLVAVPLCLGIALASGAPLFSGIIAGIVGGIVVGAFSKSPLGVSGPAAGLAVIVLTAIQELGAFEVFLLAVVLAGILQIILGFLKAGIIGYYFPSSVIKGMLSGIGIIIILKQIPHAVGYDKDYEGSLSFVQPDGHNTISELYYMLGSISTGALIITSLSLLLLALWERPFMKKLGFTKMIQGPLVVVGLGIVLGIVFNQWDILALNGEQLVQIPVATNYEELKGLFTFPDFASISNPAVWVTAVTIAIVASLETLLCLDATDKLDPEKRNSPTNRELKAQGIGNLLSGLVGGLPITQVIVRSSTNIQSGGKTKLSAISHGFILLIFALALPNVLNLIPLASLAAILFLVGYKLAKPSLFVEMYKKGSTQFAPFIITIIAIVFTDLLTGIGIGMAVAIFTILYNNYRKPFFLSMEKTANGDSIVMRLPEDLTFINKAQVQKVFDDIPSNSMLTLDASNTINVDNDVKEIIEEFKIAATHRNIELKYVPGPWESKAQEQQYISAKELHANYSS